MAQATLFTGTINGYPLRFFDMAAGIPELPWYAIDDLPARWLSPRRCNKSYCG